jgi:hypothetical protein
MTAQSDEVALPRRVDGRSERRLRLRKTRHLQRRIKYKWRIIPYNPELKNTSTASMLFVFSL